MNVKYSVARSKSNALFKVYRKDGSSEFRLRKEKVYSLLSVDKLGFLRLFFPTADSSNATKYSSLLLTAKKTNLERYDKLIEGKFYSGETFFSG